MKTTEHGIVDNRDVENVYHMRLMTLLQELVRGKGYKLDFAQAHLGGIYQSQPFHGQCLHLSPVRYPHRRRWLLNRGTGQISPRAVRVR